MPLRDWLPAVLAVLVTLGFFGFVAVMLFHEIPAANSQMLNITLGTVGTGWVTCLSYYVGTTVGAQRKDETIRQLSKPPNGGPPPAA